MANVLDIRRRIKSVRSTEQITKAMKMVSAAKLRRAQDRILKARPYARQMLAVLNSLATRADVSLHPLLKLRGDERIELMVITGDRGLCGSFNNTIIKHAIEFLETRKNHELSLHLIGKKGRDFFRRRKYNIRSEFPGIFSRLTYDSAAKVAQTVISAYTEGSLDAIYLIYNEFKSVMQQRVTVERLLPIARLELPGETPVDYIYEPDPLEIFNVLLPKHVEIQIYHALLESAAAEHGARMTAMDAATRNAVEMIENLTLTMNRVRQASITRELIEIVSGAEAL